MEHAVEVFSVAQRKLALMKLLELSMGIDARRRRREA